MGTARSAAVLTATVALRVTASAAMLATASVALGAAAPLPDRAGGVDASSTPLDVSDRAIRKAIADSHDPLDDVRPSAPGGFGTGPARQARIDRAFRAAEVPTCLTPEALKFDPPTVGPFGLGGFLVLPYWAHAIVTGRCRH